jgi:hypothetical protein
VSHTSSRKSVRTAKKGTDSLSIAGPLTSSQGLWNFDFHACVRRGTHTSTHTHTHERTCTHKANDDSTWLLLLLTNTEERRRSSRPFANLVEGHLRGIFDRVGAWGCESPKRARAATAHLLVIRNSTVCSTLSVARYDGGCASGKIEER